jgi:hypothetical protein
MIPTKVCRGVAIAAVLSFLVPPMLIVTVLEFEGAFAHGFESPEFWLPVIVFGFSLLTCLWVPHSSRARIAITIVNAIILLCCLMLGLALLLGLTHLHF